MRLPFDPVPLIRSALALIISAASVAVFAQPSGHVPGRLLVKFDRTVNEARARSAASTVRGRLDGEIPRIGVRVVRVPVNSERSAVRALARRADVEFAELDQRIAPNATPNDPYFGSQWHLSKIAAPLAWGVTTGSSSVIIAILDTGVDSGHPDLAPRMVPGWNFYNNNADSSDVHGHGTAVAGAAAAAGNNAMGVAGVSWNSKIMPCRISDPAGYGSYSAMASALTWASDRNARVANISYEVSTSLTVRTAAQYFQSRGGVVAIAAGNSTRYETAGDNPYVLTVSATASNDALTSWSNTGNNIDLASPGQGIYTTVRGGGYGSMSGTSFSSPIVAGAAALVISANPNLTGAQAQQALIDGADDFGPAGWDPAFGWGRLNADRAVARALNSGGGGPPSDTEPPTVSFSSPADGATVSGTINVAIAATDNVGVTSVELLVDMGSLGTRTSAPYTFSWDTRNMANGMRVLTATAMDAVGNSMSRQIAVNVQNAAPDTVPPTVSILSPSGGNTVGNTLQVSVDARDNVGVTKVELYLGNKLVTFSTSAPFSLSWNSRRLKRGTHKIKCKAFDEAGNWSWSQEVTIVK